MISQFRKHIRHHCSEGGDEGSIIAFRHYWESEDLVAFSFSSTDFIHDLQHIILDLIQHQDNDNLNILVLEVLYSRGE